MFILAGTDMNASRQRATDMLALLKEAKELGSQKCYDAEVKEALEKNKRWGWKGGVGGRGVGGRRGEERGQGTWLTEVL